MKNNLFILFLSISLASQAQPNNKKIKENDLVSKKLKGKITSIIEFYYRDKKMTDLYWKIDYQYNVNGNLVSEDSYEPSDGHLLSKSIYKYDNNDNKISLYIYGSHENLEGKNIYKYDESGNNSQIERYESNKLVNTIKYKYADNGSLLEQNDVMQKISYKYDDKGNLIESNGDGNHPYRYTYNYDENGNLIQQVEYEKHGSGKKNSYEYEYDASGNWTIQTEYFYPKQVSKIIVRKITYFDNTKTADIEAKSENKKVNELIKPSVVYKVLLLSSDKKIPLNSDRLKNVEKPGMYIENGIYKYTAGEFANQKDAKELQLQLRSNGFKDAFVITMQDGKRITIENK